MQHKKRLGTIVLLACTALIGGALFATGPANAVRESAKSVWTQIRPQADKRYVKKTDQNKIVRVASISSDTTSSVSGTSATYLTTTIKAPGKGFLAITGNETYSIGAATPVIHCGISVNGNSDWVGDMGLASIVSMPSSWGQCAATPTIKVAKGSYTIAYQAHNDGSGSATAYGGQLRVVYMPYNGSGKTPKVVAPRHGPVHDVAR